MWHGRSRCVVFVFVVGVWLSEAVGGGELPVRAGLELRFDATAFSNRRPGYNVTEWRDTSGRQRHATGGNGGAVYGQASTPAGLYAVSFHDICDEALSFCYNPNDRDITVVAVSRSLMEATDWPYYFRGFIGWPEIAGETPLALGGFNATQTVVALSGYGEEGIIHSIAISHVPATGFTVNTVRLDSAAGILEVFRNKRSLGRLAGIEEPIQGAAACGYIGGMSACDGLGWAGDIAEILVYSRALTDVERQAVEGYLHDKWLLALKAYNPNPPDGAVDVLLELPAWSPGHTARQHELYIGTTPHLGPGDRVFSGSLWPPVGFKPPDWKPQTTYFWRVDEVEANRARVHTGNVWSFVTAPSTAHGPRPRDGARFVDPHTAPSWQPGLHMVGHDVYFGANRQQVLDGTGGTFRGRLNATTFAPGPLAAEKAYFWRIDEAAADGQIHRGPLWSFMTLGPGGGVKADYFNNMSRYGAPAVSRVDSSIDFLWGDGSPDPALEPDYFSVRWTGDLEPVFSDTYTFTVRTNGYVTLWVGDVKLIERRLLTPAPVEDKGTLTLTAGKTYPIRMEYEVGRGQAVIQLFWQSASMPRQIIPPGLLQPPVRARAPFPAAGAVETQHDLRLRWTPGWKATHHDLYFGRDANEVAAATTETADVYLGRLPGHVTEVRSGKLEWGQSYYWRVDAVNEAQAKGLWKGNVWSFATADFIPVDNFENYSEQDGNRIYETWVDGWINGTGSTVGYVISGSWPIRVRRGVQSMPFGYDNTRPPHYSETQRTWSTPQDWTAHGADELSLWLAGAPVSFRETAEGGVILSGSGGEMECTYDPYRFVYRRLDGDGEIVARIESLSNAQGWARAGVLIADTPDVGSQYALAAVTAGYGLLFGNCPYDSSMSIRTLHEDVSVPYWVRLTRTGNQLTAGHSQDGVIWEDVTDANGLPMVITMELPAQVYIGLCVSSHKWDVTTTAEFSGIALTGSVSESWEAAEMELDQPGNSQDSLYVALTDAKGRLGLVVHPDPAAVNVADWTRWAIPLDHFAQAGVDLKAIKSMQLGIGDRARPRPNGAGMIYIDDIRVIDNP